MARADASASDASTAALAQDLRRSVSAFVRAVRQDTGTVRSAQSEALDLLSRMGPMNVAALAARRGVTHQAMRLVTAPLLAGGAVRRVTDPADGRSRLLSISPAGLEALARERDARASFIEDAIRARLTPGEQDLLRAAVALLDQLTSAAPQEPDAPA